MCIVSEAIYCTTNPGNFHDIIVNDVNYGSGMGKTKGEAKEAAARDALLLLER